MKTIWKYPLAIKDESYIECPIIKILHVGLDPQEVPCVWVEVDTNIPVIKVRLCICGTGNPIPYFGILYYGSFVQGQFVWHVYG